MFVTINVFVLFLACKTESKQIVASGASKSVTTMSQILQNESKPVKARQVEMAASTTVYAALQKIESNFAKAKCVRRNRME